MQRVQLRETSRTNDVPHNHKPRVNICNFHAISPQIRRFSWKFVNFNKANEPENVYQKRKSNEIASIAEIDAQKCHVPQFHFHIFYSESFK